MLELGAWDAWRPERVAERLAGVDVPWYVAAGWAVDLFLREQGPGPQSRPHDDLEIGVGHPWIDRVLAG